MMQCLRKCKACLGDSYELRHSSIKVDTNSLIATPLKQARNIKKTKKTETFAASVFQRMRSEVLLKDEQLWMWSYSFLNNSVSFSIRRGFLSIKWYCNFYLVIFNLLLLFLLLFCYYVTPNDSIHQYKVSGIRHALSEI